jgi:hypothetical protein
MRHTKLGRKQLWLSILLISCLVFSGCPEGRDCSECANVEFRCQNDCAVDADNPELTDCKEDCKSARTACEQNCQAKVE